MGKFREVFHANMILQYFRAVRGATKDWIVLPVVTCLTADTLPVHTGSLSTGWFPMRNSDGNRTVKVCVSSIRYR